MPELLKADADVRMALVPEADVAGQQADRHRQHGRDLEVTGLERQCRARTAATSLDCPERGARLRQKRATGRGQRDPARQPLEYRAPELLLERADVLRERRLRDADAARGTRERSLFDD